MKDTFVLLLSITAMSAAVDSAFAHHAFTPVYDGDQTLTIEGVVTEFRFVNPHALLLMDVTDESGNVARWSVEMSGRLNLIVGGWTDDSISPGDQVTISGNPTHSGSSSLFLRRLVRADGTELLTPGAVRNTTIEEARRERARNRIQSD